jgi:transposase
VSVVRVEPISDEAVEALLERVRAQVDPADYAMIELLAGTVRTLYRLLEDKGLSLNRLRRMLFGPSTEKTAQVLDEDASQTDGPGADQTSPAEALADETLPEPEPTDRKRKGHGRNGLEAYPGAERIAVSRPDLSFGCACPACQQGKVYTLPAGGVLRMTAGPLVVARIYELDRWRCNLCGEVFTAPLPAEAGDRKYDPSVGSLIALLKYGAGLPFYRLERLQAGFGVPLPASTQWEIVREAAEAARPVLDALIHEAAQGDVVHNDDTGMTILDLTGPHEAAVAADQSASSGAPDARTGVFTSGVVARTAEQTIALYFTGREHAGERLAQVLAKRASEAPPPIQMCDGLSRNRPGDWETILANCLAHGRRPFVEIAPNFPEDCRTVLEALRDVYRNDALARQQNLSPEARLAFHQAQSAPVMDRLHQWLQAQFAEKRVEPNSGLGKAIAYLLSRWDALTLFLRQPNAPLDNNICERALKLAILHRKNAYFYKTQNGASVGDLFMSLIHTCRLCGANPFDYLTQLQTHADRVADSPQQWLPWNYRDTLNHWPDAMPPAGPG